VSVVGSWRLVGSVRWPGGGSFARRSHFPLRWVVGGRHLRSCLDLVALLVHFYWIGSLAFLVGWHLRSAVVCIQGELICFAHSGGVFAFMAMGLAAGWLSVLRGNVGLFGAVYSCRLVLCGLGVLGFGDKVCGWSDSVYSDALVPLG